MLTRAHYMHPRIHPRACTHAHAPTRRAAHALSGESQPAGALAGGPAGARASTRAKAGEPAGAPPGEPAGAPTGKRWLDRVVPEDPTDAVQKLQSTRERVLRSSNEIVRQMFLFALLYVLVVALPVVWSRVAYLLPLVLLTYNVIALKTLSVYVHGSIRGRLLRKLLPMARQSARVSTEVEASAPQKG